MCAIEACPSTLGLSPGEGHKQGQWLGEQTNPEGKMIFPRKFPQSGSKMLQEYIEVNGISI